MHHKEFSYLENLYYCGFQKGAAASWIGSLLMTLVNDLSSGKCSPWWHTSSGWQIRSWQRWTRPILWAHLFMWHFTKPSGWQDLLSRVPAGLHLLLLLIKIFKVSCAVLLSNVTHTKRFEMTTANNHKVIYRVVKILVWFKTLALSWNWTAFSSAYPNFSR